MNKWCSQRLRRGRIWLDVGYWLFVRRRGCGSTFSKVATQKTARIFSASSAILQRSCQSLRFLPRQARPIDSLLLATDYRPTAGVRYSSRTQWHFVPRDDTFALVVHEGTKGFELESFWRVLDVVEVLDVLDFSAPFLVAVSANPSSSGKETA